MKKLKKSKSFEDSISKLEELVEKMELGNTTLEESLESFEEGMGLIKSCQEMLSTAEKRMQRYIKNSDGSFEIEDEK
tara:strand:- start:250 stop:480 length:231 start_codon:yes stop_codon:yes gene_type:complete